MNTTTNASEANETNGSKLLEAYLNRSVVRQRSGSKLRGVLAQHGDNILRLLTAFDVRMLSEVVPGVNLMRYPTILTQDYLSDFNMGSDDLMGMAHVGAVVDHMTVPCLYEVDGKVPSSIKIPYLDLTSRSLSDDSIYNGTVHVKVLHGRQYLVDYIATRHPYLKELTISYEASMSVPVLHYLTGLRCNTLNGFNCPSLRDVRFSHVPFGGEINLVRKGCGQVVNLILDLDPGDDVDMEMNITGPMLRHVFVSGATGLRALNVRGNPDTAVVLARCTDQTQVNISGSNFFHTATTEWNSDTWTFGGSFNVTNTFVTQSRAMMGPTLAGGNTCFSEYPYRVEDALAEDLMCSKKEWYNDTFKEEDEGRKKVVKALPFWCMRPEVWLRPRCRAKGFEVM